MGPLLNSFERTGLNLCMNKPWSRSKVHQFDLHKQYYAYYSLVKFLAHLSLEALKEEKPLPFL